MQVNSAQDYLTRYKRRVLASTYSTTPPEQKNKTNSLFMSIEANSAQTRQRHQAPTVVSAWGGVPGGATYFNSCSNCPPWTGIFSTVNTKDGVNRQALMPIGWRAVA